MKRDPRIDPRPGDVLKTGLIQHRIKSIQIEVRFDSGTPDGTTPTRDKYDDMDEFRAMWKDAEVIHAAE